MEFLGAGGKSVDQKCTEKSKISTIHNREQKTEEKERGKKRRTQLAEIE